ncbi:LAFA_0D11936g1_1 [Lachancea sp. 'fantastica']|nr:LAFA_0D11936g1_1 [Lachancea sp. 'fantastica']
MSVLDDKLEGVGPLLSRVFQDSALSARFATLEEVIALLQDQNVNLDEDTDKEIAMGVMESYLFIRDGKSMQMVILLFESLFKRSPSGLKGLTKFIRGIVTKMSSTRAVADYMNLLDWINALLRISVLQTEDFENATRVELLQLLCFTAQSVETALDVHEGTKRSKSKQNQHRRRIRQSVLQSITKTFTSALKNGKETEFSVDFISKATLDQAGAAKLPAAGVLAVIGGLTKAAIQLLQSQPAHHAAFAQNSVVPFCAYVGKDVILSKDSPSPFCIETFFTPFAHEFVTTDLFSTHIVPNLEKCILRSSEIGFPLASEFYSSVDPAKVNLSSIFVDSKLMTQSFSSLKSSKETIRSVSLGSMLVLLHSIKNCCSSSDLQKLVAEAFKNLKSNLHVDYKIIVSRLLRATPPSASVSSDIVNGLANYLSKESNEVAMEALLQAYFYQYSKLDAPPASAITLIRTGLTDKKQPIKKLWLAAFLSILDAKSIEEFRDQSKEILDYLRDVVSYPSKYTARSVLSCFTGIDRLSVMEGDELATQVKSLLVEEKRESRSIGHAWLVVTLSVELSSEERTIAVELLRRAYERNTLTTGMDVIDALERAVVEGTFSDREGITLRYVTPIIMALCRDVDDKEALKKVLIQFLVLSQYPKLKLKSGWAGLVLQANMNPENLIAEYSNQLFSRFKCLTEDLKIQFSALYDSAVKSITYAAFINPSTIAPLVVALVKCELESSRLQGVDASQIEIWRGADGELVFDVLQKSNKALENKNSRDYETLKWEEEVRKKQAQKNSGTKKYTKEEKDLIDAQLLKEAGIRKDINLIVTESRRTLSLVSQLSEEASLVDNGAAVWFPVAVSDILAALGAPAFSELLPEQGVETFLSLSSTASERLGTMRRSIAVATLRAFDIKGIPASACQENLLELISRVLFRVKFVANKKRFESLTLTFLLPLLSKVLEEGKRISVSNSDKPLVKSEFVEEDKEEEQLLLAMEIIGGHAESFADPDIPRQHILEVLLSLLSISSKARSAKECFLALCQNVSLSPSQTDLNLILGSLMAPNDFVRATVLEAVDDEFDLAPYMSFSPQVFILMQDASESNREAAASIWQLNNFKVCEELLDSLFDYFSQGDSGLRLFVAKSYATALHVLTARSSELFGKYFVKLMEFYSLKARIPDPIIDEYGLVVVSSEAQKDCWEDRSSAAIAFRECSNVFPPDSKWPVEFIKFLVNSGSLGDRESLVRQEVKEAGIEVIAQHGSRNVEDLIPVFEEALKVNQDVATKENVIILYGTLARHLAADDARVTTIVERLLNTLETPSEEVQHAISTCISPLVGLLKSQTGHYLKGMMLKLLDPKAKHHSRRGAAWGLAGLVKGLGIGSLSEYDIIHDLMDASEDKKDPQKRESVAFAFECLSKSLGKFFEPYVIEILPNILKNLGDSVPEVRNATADATKSIMANTTGFGVKKLIPVAVNNLEDISWRTKRGSVELLGNMAYLDPTQLSASLSTIVPEIVAVLNDSHKEVRKAADQSLNRFGEVIRNPEIQVLVPTLIKAIGDPTKYTEDALNALIQTQFVHYIDGPSLALIIHVIHRGMRERSANTKRKACKIVGNMAILVDANDLVPYLQQLVDEVETAMVDPVPSTRATAARALGALVERLGEDKFPHLIPRLLDTLSDDSKAGDRMGSAQALSEVISGLGLSKLDEMLPTIMAGVTSVKSYVREGFMPLLLFLPVCFGPQFAPYVSQIIQPILSGLADPDENISDTSLKAGKLLVKNYATKAIDLLLPELEKGMFDENERIRLSSVQLTSDLLFQVTGISSKNEFDDEDGEANHEVTKQLLEVLGQDRRDRILSSLFVCRSDTSGVVRATTVDVWKAIVPNTPRTVKEILPTLTSIVVVHLASASASLRHIAAQTLGDLVRRVGSNALSQLLPVLEGSLAEARGSESKQGVCIALRELLQSSSYESLVDYQSTIVNIIRRTLVDDDGAVRESAALSFDAFQEVFGKIAVDEVLPHLLNMLGSTENSEYALLALQEIMSTKSEVIFPILIPTLLSPPIDAFRARALGSLAQVAGSALYKRLSVIINALVNTLAGSTQDEKTVSALEDALGSVLNSVDEVDGMHPLMQHILSLMRDENKAKRLVILKRLPAFFEETTLSYDIYTPEIVSQSIMSFDDEDPDVVQAIYDELSVLIKKQDKSMLGKLVKPAKQALDLVGKENTELAVFKLPKGPSCILSVFLHGLMYGSNEEREIAAMAIADIVKRTPSANLRSFVTIITGPLIRVVGERFSGDVKAAILYALNVLFAKIPQFLRPFIPQLQRTFVKSLSDASNETLRLRAAKALGSLIEYQPRVDPLVLELVTGARQTEDDGVKTALLNGLLEIVSKAGSKLNENSKHAIVNLVEEQILSVNDKLATAYAKLIGSLSGIMTKQEAQSILSDKVLSVDITSDSGRFAILTLNSFLRDAPSHLFEPDTTADFVEYLVNAARSTTPYISDNALTAIGKLLLLVGETKSPFGKQESQTVFELPEENIKSLVEVLCEDMLRPASNSLDSRRLSLVVVRTMARFKFEECVKPFYDLLGPSIFSCLRDVIIPVKLAAEKAYLAVFRLVEEEKMESFQAWSSELSGPTLQNYVGDSIQLRSITDYTNRVGKRLAGVERERIAAGGDPETVFSDCYEDESEIWAVGGVELIKDA